MIESEIKARLDDALRALNVLDSASNARVENVRAEVNNLLDRAETLKSAWQKLQLLPLLRRDGTGGNLALFAEQLSEFAHDLNAVAVALHIADPMNIPTDQI
jgi:hypothetical protein